MTHQDYLRYKFRKMMYAAAKESASGKVIYGCAFCKNFRPVWKHRDCLYVICPYGYRDCTIREKSLTKDPLGGGDDE